MKLIKLGKTMIRCMELVEKHPNITGAAVSRIVEVDCDNIRGYLSRVTRQGLVIKHRPKGSTAPTFTAVEGWRDRVEFRNDIGNPKARKVYPYKPKKIDPLPMGQGGYRLPARVINSVWSLGNM